MKEAFPKAGFTDLARSGELMVCALKGSSAAAGSGEKVCSDNLHIYKAVLESLLIRSSDIC